MYNRNLSSVLRSRFSSKANPFDKLRKTLTVKSYTYNYYSLPDLRSSNYSIFPSFFLFKITIIQMSCPLASECFSNPQ